MTRAASPRWSTLCTLTETHVGTEGTRGAIDLPIAREATTGLPFLPDTSLKGVARAAAERSDRLDPARVERLFGSALASGRGDEDDRRRDHTVPGALGFLQGSLLLYPLRSLNRLFVHATCPHLLERLDRFAQAFGLAPPWGDDRRQKVASLRSALDGAGALVGDPDLAGTLFLERVAVEARQVDALKELAASIGSWLPEQETAWRRRLPRDLVVLPDDLFGLLLETAPPVRPRIKLNSRGTTEDLPGDAGNLWYEERLPADVLFWTLLVPREVGGSGSKADERRVTDDDMDALAGSLGLVQVGGGASTGHGQCYWHVQPAAAVG